MGRGEWYGSADDDEQSGRSRKKLSSSSVWEGARPLENRRAPVVICMRDAEIQDSSERALH